MAQHSDGRLNTCLICEISAEFYNFGILCNTPQNVWIWCFILVQVSSEVPFNAASYSELYQEVAQVIRSELQPSWGFRVLTWSNRWCRTLSYVTNASFPILPISLCINPKFRRCIFTAIDSMVEYAIHKLLIILESSIETVPVVYFYLWIIRPEKSEIFGTINNTHVVLLKFSSVQCNIHHVDTDWYPLLGVWMGFAWNSADVW